MTTSRCPARAHPPARAAWRTPASAAAAWSERAPQKGGCARACTAAHATWTALGLSPCCECAEEATCPGWRTIGTAMSSPSCEEGPSRAHCCPAPQVVDIHCACRRSPARCVSPLCRGSSRRRATASMSSAIALKAPPLAAAGAATSAAARPSACSPHAAAPFPPPGQELCGEPVTAVLTVPACKGLAVRVAKGQLLRVTNISGVQVRRGVGGFWVTRGRVRSTRCPLARSNASDPTHTPVRSGV